MGHHISAVVLNGSFNEDQARLFDLKAMRLTPELTLFPLDAGFCDYWSEKLGVSGHKSRRPLLNSDVVHLMVDSIAENALFAVIETDYAGRGSQAAAVYRGETEIMPPTVTGDGPIAESIGPINDALRHLGVVAREGRDEFDTLGLGQYRDFYDLF